VSGRCVAVVAACGLAAGCGGGGPLEPAGGFEPPSGSVFSGRRVQHESANRMPAYRLEDPREGTPLRYRVRVRNGVKESVTITGVAGDQDVDLDAYLEIVSPEDAGCPSRRR
jgi:hypothetical protein